MQTKGIDVSYAQGKINWSLVKADGIQFAMLRCGYGSDIANQDDAQFAANVAGCEAAGIPWGAYLYSYATDIIEAESEVLHILRLLNGRVPLYPVYIDMEDADGYKAKRNVSNTMCADICAHVCRRLTEAGYLAGVYANKDWLVNRINDSRLTQYETWLAQWNDKPTYTGSFGMWQYTSSGAVNGISGRVDMNYCYEDYPAVIMAKELNGYKKPVPVPAPDPSSIKVGDTVAFSGGNVYSSSTATAAAAKKDKATCQVTGISMGAPHPYHCIGGGVYGWIDAASIGTAPAPAAAAPAFKVGDSVKLLTEAYADGKTIPLWVRLKTVYVRQIGTGNKAGQVLFSWLKTGAVTGWVWAKDIKKA